MNRQLHPPHITRRQVEVLAWAVRQARFLRGALIPPHDLPDEEYRKALEPLKEHDQLVREAQRAVSAVRAGKSYKADRS